MKTKMKILNQQNDGKSFNQNMIPSLIQSFSLILNLNTSYFHFSSSFSLVYNKTKTKLKSGVLNVREKSSHWLSPKCSSSGATVTAESS